MMRTLAPALIATGLYEHATFKNPEVQQILEEANSVQNESSSLAGNVEDSTI